MHDLADERVPHGNGGRRIHEPGRASRILHGEECGFAVRPDKPPRPELCASEIPRHHHQNVRHPFSVNRSKDRFPRSPAGLAIIREPEFLAVTPQPVGEAMMRRIEQFLSYGGHNGVGFLTRRAVQRIRKKP